MIKQDAGTKQLGDIAPKFAQLNDEVLFGEVWSREDKLSLRDRSLITVAALLTKGIVDHSIQYHLENAKNHGVSKTEMVEVITQLAFYAGWPNAWAVFPMVKKVYQDEKEILGDRNDDDVLSVYEDIQDSISTTDNTSTYEERIRQISEDWETKYNDLDDYWRTKYTSRFFTTPDEVVDRHEEDTKSEEEFVSFDELFDEKEGV